MPSPVSRLPLSTAQIAVLQARPAPKPATGGGAQPVAASAPAGNIAPAPGGGTRPPYRGSLLDIVA